MPNNTAELMNLGISCLIDNLGVVQAETFISVLLRERSDYTKWRQLYFGAISDEDYIQESIEHDREHPFHSSKMAVST